mmetsp:Transcript_10740/g.23657  ORF Transcript_10740/g.23657 Transcript_10740/m.23657 type:complete len:283 (-) Transcript_10740:853-1701(-)
MSPEDKDVLKGLSYCYSQAENQNHAGGPRNTPREARRLVHEPYRLRVEERYHSWGEESASNLGNSVQPQVADSCQCQGHKQYQTPRVCPSSQARRCFLATGVNHKVLKHPGAGLQSDNRRNQCGRNDAGADSELRSRKCKLARKRSHHRCVAGSAHWSRSQIICGCSRDQDTEHQNLRQHRANCSSNPSTLQHRLHKPSSRGLDHCALLKEEQPRHHHRPNVGGGKVFQSLVFPQISRGSYGHLALVNVRVCHQHREHQSAQTDATDQHGCGLKRRLGELQS